VLPPAVVSAPLAAAKRRDSSLRSSADNGAPLSAAVSSAVPIALAIGTACVLASLAFRSPETRNHYREEHTHGNR